MNELNWCEWMLLQGLELIGLIGVVVLCRIILLVNVGLLILVSIM